MYILLPGLPAHAPRHAATPLSSSPGTSAVPHVVFIPPVVDVAVGMLVDACPRAAARLALLSFLKITDFSLSQSSPLRFLSAEGI